MISFTFKIDKELWNIDVIEEQNYQLIVDTDSEAYTDTNQRRIVFCKERITMGVIEHEMTHAYFDCLCLRSCNEFSIEQMEEIIAEFIPKYAKKILKSSKALNKMIEKLSNEKTKEPY